MKTLLPEINSADKRFHNGNPATGEQGTRVTDTWLNDVQDRVRDVQAEAHYVLQKAGFTPKAETQTQLYQAIVKIIEDNRNSAGIAEKGEVQLTNDYSGDSEVLGLTQKAGKALKALIDSLTRNLSNYIPNSKKSNAVNSSSSDTIATSAAAKTAYDKGVEAKNAADNAQRTADEAVRFNRNYFAGDLNTLNDKHEICYLEQAQTKNRNFPADAYQWGVLHVYSNGTLGSQVYYADNGELWARTRWHSHNWNEWKRLDGLDIPTTRASKRALSTDDLNNISASGIYGQNANINATPARHYPIQQAGMLLVTEHSGYGAQQLYAPFNAGYLYARGRNANNGWDDWKRIDGLDKVLKSGDTMTGNLTINHGEPRVHGNRNNSNNWYVGLPNGSSNDLNLHSYAHNTSLILLSDRVKATKPLYVGSERVALLGDFTNPVFTLTNNANSSGSLNNISGTKFLSFGDGALNGLGLPGGADWVGIQIADQSGQKTQIISAGLNNHYIRTNDDLSKNVWHLERLLTDVTLQRLVNRRDYNRTIKGTNPNWDSGTSKNISVTGFVIIYPDGKIEQFFHFKAMRVPWFAPEDALGVHERAFEIPVQLWTAMPNKIVYATAQFTRPVANNITAGGESEEWTMPLWNMQKQGSSRDRCNFTTSRFLGSTDEPIDFLVKVEGY